jgi:hypothetical protein
MIKVSGQCRAGRQYKWKVILAVLVDFKNGLYVVLAIIMS